MITAKGHEAETEDGAPDKSGPRRMLNEKQVLEIVPVGRTTLYRMEKAGRFPRSTYISPNRRVWYEDEIIAWQNAVDEFNPNGDGAKDVASVFHLVRPSAKHETRAYWGPPDRVGFFFFSTSQISP